MINYKDIKQVHLELSTRCNAACPDCPRNFRGVDIIETYPLCDMSLEQFKTIFTPEFIQQLESFLFNGNYGDFITARDGLKIVEYLRSCSSTLNIEISTNASARPNIWEPLAALGVQVDFRIDGLKDTHHLYRQNTDFEFIIKNADKFISAGGKAVWMWILFDHNKHQVEEGRTLAKQMGFTDFRIIDVGRNVMPVFTSDKRLSHVIGNYTGSTDFDELYRQSQYYKEDIWGPVRHEQRDYKIDCYSKRNREIYVSANGEVYPCCWLGFYPLQSNRRPSNPQLKEIIKNNNALVFGIEKAINWFNSIEKSWEHTVPDGKIYGCNETCGIKST